MNGKPNVQDDIERILIEEKTLAARVKELGAQISADYAASPEPILLIGILRGAVIFLADLIRAIDIPLTFDFMAVASYGKDTRSSGAVRILKDLAENIEGKQVLIVEDIIDTGLTLSYLVKNLKARNPAGIKICTLLNKPDRRKIKIVPDYNGFDIEDVFAVGYGLDFAGNYRNLPFVGVLKSAVYAE